MKKCNSEIWFSVKTNIESKIMSGEYGVGDKIPTMIEMMKIYGIGRTTAQRVIDSLADDEIIVKRVQAGSFVLPAAPEKISKKRQATIEEQFRTLIEVASNWGMEKNELMEIISKL